MRRIVILVAAAIAGMIGVLLIGAPQAQAADTAKVSVVHGIPNTPVNVFVNGKSTLTDFKPQTVAGPLDLPSGSYEVTVFPAKDTQGTGTPVIKASAAVEAGKNYTLVAHLTPDSKPTLTPYVNDVSAVAAGNARLVVRHGAAAPAVDVRANGNVAFSDLTNPKEASADLPAGSIDADVVLAGTSTVAIGPATLDLAEGTSTTVYAVGSASDKTLALVPQTINGLDGAPGGVPAGTGGLLDSGSSTPAWVWLVAAGGTLLVVAGATGLYRVSRRTN